MATSTLLERERLPLAERRIWVFIPSLTILLVAAIVAQAVRSAVPLSGWNLVSLYVSTSAASTFLLFLGWLFIEIAGQARHLADAPIANAWTKIIQRIDMLLFPLLIFPLFLACYTTAKVGIPFLVGYSWERFWADADLAIFGVDPWRLTWQAIPAWGHMPLQVFYTMVWGGGLVFGGIIVALYGSRRTAGRFFTAMMLTWLVGGVGMAYLTSAGGPVFAHLFDPSLAGRFVELRDVLLSTLGAENPIVRTQEYLAYVNELGRVTKGGGISAMPSMHVGTAAILVAVAWPWRFLRVVALVAWCLTQLGSVHFGYHYFLDGIAATFIALGAWALAGRLHPATTSSPVPPAQQAQP